MKHTAKQFAQTGLLAGLLAAGLLTGTPSRAETAPTSPNAHAPVARSTVPDTKARFAWDRVGSPLRTFV